MEALEYLKRLEKNGYESYIVGGFVRDYLLGYASNDIDIATNATPKEICSVFGINGGDDIGCVNIKTSEYNVDITTYRKESNYIGHTPKKIKYVKDILTDLKRRDFTINAICMNSKGEIYDPLNGQKDLESRTIKVVGNTNKKLKEDPLRMLRALRIAIVYDFKLGEKELMFIVNNRNLFGEISYSRKKEEIGKILISDNSIKGLELLKQLGLLDVLEINYSDDIVFTEDYIGMWAQLEYSSKYPFSKIENSRLKVIRDIVKYGKIDKEILFKYGVYDSLVAGSILKLNKDDIKNMYDDMQIHSKDELDISGKDIKNILHMDSSPKIKFIKIDLIKQILSGALPNERDKLIKYIIEKWK